jgi:hypothetical protein
MTVVSTIIIAVWDRAALAQNFSAPAARHGVM